MGTHGELTHSHTHTRTHTHTHTHVHTCMTCLLIFFFVQTKQLGGYVTLLQVNNTRNLNNFDLF